MPTYEFQCGDCGARFEVRASFAEKEKGLEPRCPQCGSENVGQIIGNVILFSKSGRVDFTSEPGGTCCSSR